VTPPAVVDDLVTRLQTALAEGPALRLAVLFGSNAAGRARPDSDVDIAVLDPRLDADAERALVVKLSREAGADVDLIRLEQASTVLRWQIATKGMPLVEANPGEFARFRATAASEYLDFEPALTHYGEIFRQRLAGWVRRDDGSRDRPRQVDDAACTG
jgi:predicted nucleotidyltransferase